MSPRVSEMFWSGLKRCLLVAAAALQMLLAYTAVLWMLGPQALDTRCYVQSVSADAAVICKVDSKARQLRFSLWLQGREVQARQSGPTIRHAVRFAGLQPATSYGYRVEDVETSVVVGGVERSFRTAPTDDAATVRFVAVGDSGDLPWWYNFHPQGYSHLHHLLKWTQEPWQWEVARWMAAQRPDFFLHLGDIVYWRDLYDAHGEAFFRPFEPILGQTPIYMLAGNHDLPRAGQPVPFEQLFHHPDPAPVGPPQRSYSFAFGSVRMVVFDVTTPAWRQPPMFDWLRRQLETATEPWLVVAVHVPCFSVYRLENPQLRDELWPLLQAHGVDLVLSGDDHHYARFRRTDAAGTSPIQLIAGGGGKKLYQFDQADPRLVPGVSQSAWSFVCFEAKGLQLHCRAMTSRDAVIDSWTLDRRAGKLAANIQPGRRQRILRLRKN